MIGQTAGTSERQQGSAGWHGRVALKVIESLAARDDPVDAVYRILRIIVDESGIRCSGIRLQEGSDFPFYAFNGFSRAFVQQENSLCLRNPDGTLAADAQGRPVFDCMCGRIIRGQTLPGEDFFTSGGSFFTPSLQTLATTIDPAKLGFVRGRCIREAFQTHALVPLRRGSEIIGLLQLSDPQPHVLTGEDVAFLEQLGASVGVALANKQAAQPRPTDDTYRELFERLGWGYGQHEMIFDEQGAPTDYVTLDVNQTFEKLLGTPREMVVGKRASTILPAAELTRWLAVFSGVQNGPPAIYETYSPHNQKHFRGHAYSVKRGFFAVAFEDVTERNKARALLAESEERYRTLVEMSEDVVLLTDLDGRYIFTNSAYHTSLGFAVDEPVVPSSYERVHPDDVERVRQIRATQLERGSVSAEFRVQHRDGHWIWRSGRSTLVRDEFGKPKAILAVLHDISVRKRMEEEIRESHARLELALRSSKMGVWHWDIESDRRFFDDQACALLGMDPMTFTGTAEEIFPHLHPDDRAKLRDAIARTLSHDAPFELEYRVPWKDGSVHHVSARGALVRDQAGKAQKIQGVSWDVTERVRANEALHAVEARIRLTTEALGVGTFRWDFVSGTHEFSPEFLALYGLRPDQALEVGPDLVPLPVLDEDRPAFLAAVATANDPQGRGEVKGEFRVRLPDGSIRWLLSWARTTFVGPPDRRRPGVSVGALIDVTKDKQAEAENRKLQSQLFQAQRMESLGTLAGGIAHDFNNILAAILGGVELASLKTDALDGPQGESIRRDLNDVQRAAQRAAALVRQILSFSRRNREDRQPLLLRPLVSEACKFMRSALPSTIEIQQTLSIDGPLLANPTQMHQVVMNLLTNAGLAMPDGGRIEVGLDSVELDQRFATGHPGLAPGWFVRLTIRDTGCGIAKENLGRIFEPLFTTRSERRGTGLGLAIVHGIVTEHGGTVTVSSEVGKGATFEVFFPMHERPIAPALCEEKPLPGTERVLFVDDEETLVQMTRRGLGNLGYRVQGFVSSVEALRAFRAAPHDFDIVVSDLTMPGLTGEVLAREMRRLRPDIPVVILTGASDGMRQEGDATAGIDCVLPKPITVARLTVCLRRILDGKAPSHPAGSRPGHT
jgi:PAS domain S-box-containing protein